MLDKLETFTDLFKNLQTQCNDSPTALSWLAEQKSDIRRLAFLIGESAEQIEKHRAEKSEKHSIVPAGFITAWKEYENRYGSVMETIVAAERKGNAEKFLQ